MSKKVALVLGSGGARGYAHIGVIDEILARGYTIDCIAGCSMGAVVGGIYAAGKLREYRAWIEGLDYLDLLRLVDPSFSLGAIRGEKVFGRVREMLGEVNIEDLPIPFTAVATDLTNQQEIWFQEGSLELAMRASAAIPSLFTPVVQDNRVLVDGGLLNPLPIVPVVSSHCDLIVAVNLNANNHKQYSLPEIERPGRFDSMLTSISSHIPFWRKDGGGLSPQHICRHPRRRAAARRPAARGAVQRDGTEVCRRLDRRGCRRPRLVAGADQPELRRHAVVAGAVQDRRLSAERAGEHSQARLSFLRV